VIELYYFHGATCGLKARLAFAEKGVDFVHRSIERSYLRTPEYLALNRNGVVPTIVHDGNVLTESSCIISYVDDAFAGPALKPQGAMDRARMWWWLKRADECLPYIGILTYTISMRPEILKKSPDELKAYIEGIPNASARERRRKIIENGYDNPDFAPAVRALDLMLNDIEAALQATGWLAGPEYSLADTAMTPLIERMDELRCQPMWERSRPALTDWWARIRARPSHSAVLGKTPNPEGPQHRAAGEKAWPEVERIWTAG